MLNTVPKPLKRRLKKIAFGCITLYIMILTSLYVLQEKLLFLSTTLEQDYQYQFDYNFEELFLNTNDDARLNAIHFKVEQPKGVILYFHGNAGDLSRWGTIAELFVKRGYDVVIMDYRTYGKSTGKLKHDRFYTDAELFYDYVKAHYDEQRISLYGRSLGTCLATYLASKHSPYQLILETPYYSMVDVAKQRFPIFPVDVLLKYAFPSYKYIQEVACPITIFHGTDDEVVPFDSAKQLVDMAPESLTTFIPVTGGQHNNLADFEMYWSNIETVLP